MFSTLRLNNYSDKKLVDVGHSSSHKYISRSRHSACRACQSKKLKCSGQKAGCDRCLSKAITCLYAIPKRQPETLRSAHFHNVLHCVATHQAGPSKSATDAAEFADAGQGRISRPTCFQQDETQSGPDLLQELQAVQAEDLDVKGDIRCDNYLNCFDEDGALGQDAAYDEIWNACSGVANKESSDGGQESRIALSNGHIDPENQASAFSLNLMGTRELMGLDYRPASVCSDSFHAHASLGFGNFGNPDHQSPSGPSSSNCLQEDQPPQTFELVDLPSTTMSMSRPWGGPTFSACRCVQTALQVLELLENSNNKLHITALDHILAIQKNAIFELLPILKCRACTAAPGFVTQLIVICEKVLISFDSFTTGFHGWRPRQIRSYNHGDPDKSKTGDTQKFFLGVCEVDSEHEQRILLASLAIVQLREFHRVLLKLDEIAVFREWDIHQCLLTSLIQRLQDTATRLRVQESTHLG